MGESAVTNSGEHTIYVKYFQVTKIHTFITLPFNTLLQTMGSTWAYLQTPTPTIYLCPISCVRLLVMSINHPHVSTLTWLMMLSCISLTHYWKTICSQMFCEFSWHEILYLKYQRALENWQTCGLDHNAHWCSCKGKLGRFFLHVLILSDSKVSCMG